MSACKLKSLKGSRSASSAIDVASGHRVDRHLTAQVEAAGGIPVHETLPADRDADASVQVFQDLHLEQGQLRDDPPRDLQAASCSSIASTASTCPFVTSFGVAQPALLYTSTPYNASKNTVVINCADPPVDREDGAGQARAGDGEKYGVLRCRVHAQQLVARLDGADDRAGAQERQRRLQLGRHQEGPREIRNLQTGLTPTSPTPRSATWGSASGASVHLTPTRRTCSCRSAPSPSGAVHHERVRGPRNVRRRPARQVRERTIVRPSGPGSPAPEAFHRPTALARERLRARREELRPVELQRVTGTLDHEKLGVR